MEKRDLFGKKQYKELSIKPIKRNMSHYCFIAIRTAFYPLDFFAGIYQHSNYLFQLSKHHLEIVQDSICTSFQTFEYQDDFSKYSVFCLVNKSINKEQYLVGKNKNSCYILSQTRGKNQLSFSFDEQEETSPKDREEIDWELFKTNMQHTSVNLMNKIDYLFPVDVQTYEILKPLFFKFQNMDFLHYQFIDSKQIKDISSLLSVFYAYTEKNNEPNPFFYNSVN